MKRQLAMAGLFLAVCALVCAQNSADRVTIPARPVSGAGSQRVISVSLVHASIVVKTHAGKEVIAEVAGSAQSSGGRAMDGMRRIDSPNIAVDEGTFLSGPASAQLLTIHVPFRNGRQRDLTLTVPVDTALNLKTTHGDITVEGVHGEIDVTTLHGNVTLNAVSGTVVASSTVGALRVSMDRLDPAKPLSFSTLNGNIDVTFPTDVKANLKLKADRGEIWSDFDIVLTGTGGQGGSHTTNGAYRITMDRNIYGSINGGGVEASFHTVNGKILIHKKSK
jgi:hypothetical protein